MPLLGEQFPDFVADTTEGEIGFHSWLGNSWGVLFSHPADFTPVCTTELARVLQLRDDFAQRNVKVIALSCDTVDSHRRWTSDIRAYASHPDSHSDPFPYPVVADADRRLALLLGMLDTDELDAEGVPLTARAVFVVDPAKKLRLSLLYPATVGRNFDEILRAIDALQLTDRHGVVTPADWKVGGRCVVPPNVSAADAEARFPRGVTVTELPSGLGYMRETPHPGS